MPDGIADMDAAEILSWHVSPQNQDFKIVWHYSIPIKKVVGLQKTKISSPQNQDFKMLVKPFFSPAPACGRLVASLYSVLRSNYHRYYCANTRIAEQLIYVANSHTATAPILAA